MAHLAVEPTGFAFRKLNASLRLNQGLPAGTTTVQAMLGPDNMKLEDAIPSSWPLNGDRSAVENEFGGRAQSTEGAKALSLDQLVKDLGLDRVDLVKIDVDGYEGDVLSGAGWTTRTFAPKIVMEIAPYLHEKRPSGFAGLLDQITSLGYEMRDLVTGAPISAVPALLDTASLSGFDVLLQPSKADRPGAETGGV